MPAFPLYETDIQGVFCHYECGFYIPETWTEIDDSSPDESKPDVADQIPKEMDPSITNIECDSNTDNVSKEQGDPNNLEWIYQESLKLEEMEIVKLKREFVEKNGKIMGTELIPKDRWRLRCSYCAYTGPADNNLGACIQCTKGKCLTAYHVSCAIKKKIFLQMQDGILETFCQKHDPVNVQEQKLLKKQQKEREYIETLTVGKSVSAKIGGSIYAGSITALVASHGGCMVLYEGSQEPQFTKWEYLKIKEVKVVEKRKRVPVYTDTKPRKKKLVEKLVEAECVTFPIGNNDSSLELPRDVLELDKLTCQFTLKMNEEIKNLESANKDSKRSSKQRMSKSIETRKNATIVMDELYIYLRSMRELTLTMRNAELEILHSILDPSHYGQIPQEIVDMHRVEYDIEVTVQGMEAQLKLHTSKREELLRQKTNVSKIDGEIFNLKHETVKAMLDFKAVALELNKVEIGWAIQCIEFFTKKPIQSHGYHDGMRTLTDTAVLQPDPQPLMEEVVFKMPKLLKKGTLSSNSLKTEKLNPGNITLPDIIEEHLESDIKETNSVTENEIAPILPPFRENSFVKDTNTLANTHNGPKINAETETVDRVQYDANDNAKTEPLVLKKEIIKRYPNGVPRNVHVRAMKERNQLVDMVLNSKVDRDRFVEKWELVHANGEIGNLKSTISKLLKTVNDQQELLKTKEDENQCLKKQLEDSKRDFNVQQELEQNLEAENKELKKTNSELKENQTRLSSEVETLKIEISQSESNNIMSLQEVEKLKTNLMATQTMLATVQSKLVESAHYMTENKDLKVENQVLGLEMERLANIEKSRNDLVFENQALRNKLESNEHKEFIQQEFRIEKPREFPDGIPKKEYERAIEERNRLVEMCKLLSINLLENGVEEMYITVAKKVGGIKQRLAYSDKQNGRLRNEILQLKQEIERLRCLPLSPMPSEYESEVSEEFVWLSQLESIIASDAF
ncbi:nuA3 HAT complex component nto1 [Boothiomyces macroporosus]|uniref:NuA3 HAT complex component nto1 n=1 Tax=Boothiomyces macroporosus TaxID=261099 RepID=A0AAD5UPQ0_9FUNG|nr:nuA3 HAT complex component nto1 [Boothiomyces macroporosus]